MPSISTNGSPSISIRSEKVPESPSSALHTTYFCAPGDCSTVRHLIPAGTAAQPRGVHALDDLRWLHGQRRVQAAVAAVLQVIAQAARIGESHSRKREP